MGDLLDRAPPLLQVLQEHVGALDIGDDMFLMVGGQADAPVSGGFAAAAGWLGSRRTGPDSRG